MPFDEDRPDASAERFEQLGRYELLTRIASGGMAEVFVARLHGHGGFERQVALKRMLASIAEEERFAEMFLDEGRLAGLVDSPHVVQIYDVGQDASGALFIAMELVRGVALHRLLNLLQKGNAWCPVDIAVAILAQAAEGLAAAHAATTPLGEPLGIVHRDITPQNVLVGVDGRTRLADFGIARALHRRASTATGELKGKLGYFAPEQLSSRPATVQTDVFALGVVAWEALARRRLFAGDSPVETIEMIRRMEAPSIARVRHEVSMPLAAVIARALAKKPEDRLATAAEFASLLRSTAKVASDAAVAAYVKEWAGADIDELDARIRQAITAWSERTKREVELPAMTVEPITPEGPLPVAPHEAATQQVALPDPHPTSEAPAETFVLAPTLIAPLAEPPIANPPLATTTRSHRSRYLLAALGLLALLSGAAWWRSRPPRIEVIALPRPAHPASEGSESPPAEPAVATAEAAAAPPAVEPADPASEPVVTSEPAPSERPRAARARPRDPEAAPTRRGLAPIGGFLRELDE